MSKTVTWEEWAKDVSQRLSSLKESIGKIWGYVSELEDAVDYLLMPEQRDRIKAELKDGPKRFRDIPEPSQKHQMHAFYKAWNRLLDEKVIIKIGQGRGRPALYRLKEVLG